MPSICNPCSRLVKGCGQFASSCLPRNAHHVLRLKIAGRLHSLSSHAALNSLETKLLAAIQSYPNLHVMEISPETAHPHIFNNVLTTLLTRPFLRQLTINSACIDEIGTSTLITIGNLEKLVLQDPSRAILNVLPCWLSRLSHSLTELHLKVCFSAPDINNILTALAQGNCGSVTPGVLRSFIPYIRDRVRSITLGLSYSLTHDDIFSFLGELPELTSVELQYYLVYLKLFLLRLKASLCFSFSS